jgi:hypothetical protein
LVQWLSTINMARVILLFLYLFNIFFNLFISSVFPLVIRLPITNNKGSQLTIVQQYNTSLIYCWPVITFVYNFLFSSKPVLCIKNHLVSSFEFFPKKWNLWFWFFYLFLTTSFPFHNFLIIRNLHFKDQNTTNFIQSST